MASEREFNLQRHALLRYYSVPVLKGTFFVTFTEERTQNSLRKGVISRMDTSSTAQGGGRSFKIGNPERLAVVNQKWQSEPTDGQQGCWRKLSAVVVVAIIVVEMYL